MNRDFKITNEQILSNRWGKLREVTFEIRRHDGEMEEANEEFYDVGDGAAVLLYNKEQGTVILNHQFRLATVYNGNPSGMLTEVCAGKIDDLSPDETILKEIEEETGYSVPAVEHVMTLYMSPGSFAEKLYFYVAAYTPEMKKTEGGGKKEEGELIEIQEVPYSTAMEMIRNGAIRDAKTVVLLQYAGLNGLV